VTQAECKPLVIGPVDRRNGLSRENEQANTHNELAEYRPAPARVKTALPQRIIRPSSPSSRTGSDTSRTCLSAPKTRMLPV
jgi:hypothetical protein